MKKLAAKCVGLKDNFKCRINDVEKMNYLCDDKCCFFCDDYDNCPYKKCTKIRVFENGEVKIYDTEKASFQEGGDED